MTESRDRVVRGWGWPPRRRRIGDLGRWPYRVGICAALATLVGVFSLLERDALDPVRWGVVGLVALAVAPWIVDLLLVEVPPWLFTPTVLIPVAVLHDPTVFDPLPFLLGILVLDMALWLGFRGSAPVLVLSAAAVLWRLGDDPMGDPGWLSRPLVGMSLAWLVGLALHSQVQRVARLRAAQRSLVEQAVVDERRRVERVVGEAVTRRARTMLSDAVGEATEGSDHHETAAERLARDVLDDLHRELDEPQD